MFTDEDVEVVAGRMLAWGQTLTELGQPDLCRDLLQALDTGDGKAFHALIDRWDFLGGSTCVEVAQTMTRFVHTGDWSWSEVCTLVDHPRQILPSPTDGKGYTLPNGTILWLSDLEWWELYDRARADQAWRDANHDLLVAIGQMTCRWQEVASIQRFDLTKTYTLCPPTFDPREGRRPRRTTIRRPF